MSDQPNEKPETPDAKRQRLDVNVGLVATIGLVSVIVLWAAVVSLQALYYSADQAEQQRKDYGQSYTELRALEAQQRQRLISVAVVDRDKSVYQIPIDQAMQRYVARQSQKVAPPR